MIALGVSVIIPTYNRAQLVRRAVGNALAQTAADDEVIVVDDGSTDNTVEVLSPYRDRIRLIPGPHKGAGAARNVGIRAATRPLVAFLDSDDEWMADKLALTRALLAARPEVLFCFSDFAGRNDSGVEHNYLRRWHADPRPWSEILGSGVNYSTIAPLPVGRADFLVHAGSIYLGEMRSDYVATSTCVARRQAAGDALRFAEDLRISEDKECFARLASKGLGAYLDCETSWQWEHPGPRVSSANSYDLACARLTIMDRVWGNDPDFLARHAKAFADKRNEQLLKKARWLIAHGRTREARLELKYASKTPLAFRILAWLPGPVARGLLGLRRLLTGRRFF